MLHFEGKTEYEPVLPFFILFFRWINNNPQGLHAPKGKTANTAGIPHYIHPSCTPHLCIAIESKSIQN